MKLKINYKKEMEEEREEKTHNLGGHFNKMPSPGPMRVRRR